MDVLMEDLRSFIPGRPNEIVVGFHRLTKPVYEIEKIRGKKTHALGMARFFFGFIAIRDPFYEISALDKKTVLVHELGHVFGAVHVSDPKAIMYAYSTGNPQTWLDPDTFSIVRLTRNMDLHRGMYSLPESSIDGLIPIYEKMKRNSQEKDYYYFLGEFYRIKKMGDRAAAVWEDAIKQNQANPEIEKALQEITRDSGLIDKVGQVLQQALSGNVQSKEAEIQNALSVTFFKNDGKDVAIKGWSQYLQKDPANVPIRGNLAHAYIDTGLMDRAITLLEGLRKQYPANRAVLGNLGLAYMQNREYQKAAQFFYAALQPKTDIAPFEPKKENLLVELPEATLRFSLGTAFLKLSQGTRAVEQFRRARALDPSNQALDRLLSEAYFQSHNYVAAEKEIKEAQRKNKADPYLYLLLVKIYKTTNRQALALETAKHAIKYGDHDLQAILYREIAVMESKKSPHSAVDYFNKSLKLNGMDPDTHVELGKFYERYRMKAEASRWYGEALRISPRHQAALEGKRRTQR